MLSPRARGRTPTGAALLLLVLVMACTPTPAAPAALPAKPAATSAAPPAAAPTAAAPVASGPLTPPVKVQVGYSPASSSLPLFVAVERGYFEDQGLELELTPFTLSTDQFPALASGQLDFGGTA